MPRTDGRSSVIRRAGIALVVLVSVTASSAQAETIVTRENEKHFFREGKVEKYDGQYEHTYLLEGDRLTRTRIYDYHARKITPDETVYRVQRQLESDPVNAARHARTPVLRAIGQLDADTIETLVIGKDGVISATASGDCLVVARSKRLR